MVICSRTCNTKFLLFFVPVLFHLQVSFASDIQSLLDDPSAARAFDYCTWTYDGDKRVHDEPDVEAIMSGEVSGRTKASVVLVEAGISVSRAAGSQKLCKKEMQKGAEIYDKVLARHTRAFRKRGDFNSSDDPEIQTVQVELSQLWIQDQAARVAYLDLQTESVDGAAYWARRLSIANAKQADSESAAFMRSVLASFDWIDKDRFGARSSRQAWTLVQHADDYSDLQKLALDRMAPYLQSGGILPGNYAYLWDRVAVNAGRLQRYGTQPTWKCSEGQLTLYPMKDPEYVDDRRAEMGLGSVVNDLAEMARKACK